MLKIYISINTIIPLTISAISFVVLMFLVIFIVVISRKNNSIKSLNNFIDEINKSEFTNIDVSDNYSSHCYLYDSDFFDKSEIKNIIVPSKEVFDGIIIFATVLDFKKIYMNESFEAYKKDIKLLDDKLLIGDKKILYKEIVYINGIYEYSKNVYFLELKCFDKNNNIKFQLLDLESIFILNSKIKNYRLKI